MMAGDRAMPVSLRCATIADADRLDTYLSALRVDDLMPANAHADAALVRSALRHLLVETTAGPIWLIHAGLEPVGYVALTFVFSIEFGGQCAFLDELFVDRAHRGLGIGKEALRQVCDVEAPALGVRALFLEVSERNAA